MKHAVAKDTTKQDVSVERQVLARHLTLFGTPLLEICEDLVFGDAFGGEDLLQSEAGLLEGVPFGDTAFATRRNEVADGVAVPGDGDRHLCFE